jgi:hypothetical protein
LAKFWVLMISCVLAAAFAWRESREAFATKVPPRIECLERIDLGEHELISTDDQLRPT